MVDKGSGRPVVLVPGIQGRWEWMQPAIDALARECRVLSFSLSGDRLSGHRFDAARGFENYVHQIDETLERARVRSAVVCGVSYGGLIALHYAAARQDRVDGLVLVSTPAPDWTPTAREQRYSRHPRLFAPVFIVRAPVRLWPEIAAAFPRRRQSLSFGVRHVRRVMQFPLSPARMAERIRILAGVDFEKDCDAISVPTLIVTGERRLDRVVPVDGTSRYIERIRGARRATIEGTGHIGLITRPDRFAGIVCRFVDGLDHLSPEREQPPSLEPRAT
jgi:pimeloyl-ACP methyl ester carboxylesterase